jgi:23S rRNA (uridine2552-2'-O)-methyltransferase
MDRLREISPFFHVVLSDMAPKTTGNRMVDQARSIALAERALEIALKCLAPEGSFFCKVFQGSDFPSFLTQVKDSFKEVRIIKPKSSRSESVEIFLHAKCLHRNWNKVSCC